MVAATISRPKSRSIRHAQGFLRAKIFRFCDFGIMRSAKSWTASWKQYGQRWSNEENPHLNEKCDGFLAIDDAMVVAKGEVHHRTDHDRAVYGDGALHDFVHAQNSALRRIQNWCAQERAVNAAVRDRKGTPLELFDFQFSFTRFLRVVGDIPLQIGKRLFVSIAHNRNDQPPFRPDGDPDVVEIILNEIVSFDS